MNSKLFVALASIGLLSTQAYGQFVINEVMVTGVGTDANEFVELYGTPGTDMSLYRLELVNGNDGVAYRTHTLSGTIPADGYFVIAGGTAAPNIDYTVSPAVPTNWIQNGDPDAIRMVRISDSAVIDAVGYFATHNAGAPVPANLPADSYEGAPAGVGSDDTYNQQTGTAAPAAVTENPMGRFPDGADTNNNYNDFYMFYQSGTPGQSNALDLNNTLPRTETFGASGLSGKWQVYFTPIILETAATAVPAAIPNSPDAVSPTTWGSVKDNTGGGDQAVMVDFLGKNYTVEGQFYCGTLSTVADGTELGGLMARMNMAQNNNTANAFSVVTPIATASNYGESYYALVCDYVTGTVSAVKVFKGVITSLATSSALADGWHKLGIICDEGNVTFQVDGSTLHSLTGETPRYGYVGVGYRETSTGSTGQVRNNFDALEIKSNASGVNEWSLY